MAQENRQGPGPRFSGSSTRDSGAPSRRAPGDNREGVGSLMPLTESKSPPVQPNIQDVFLNYARRERLTVRIRLMDGSDFEGRIKNFDRFAVIVEQDGADHMIFKHAIATIRTPRAISNYFSHHQ